MAQAPSPAPIDAAGDHLLTPVLVRMLEGRVGSTAMMQLLATAPSVAMDREYPFQNSYLTYLSRLSGHLSDPRPAELGILNFVYGQETCLPPLPFQANIVEASQLGRAALGALWSAFSRAVSERPGPGARFYAEKYWGPLPRLLDAGIQPRVIDLVRDPRDIISSIRAFNHRNGQQLFGRPLAKDDRSHLRHLVVGMGMRFAEFRQQLPVPVLTVRYEDLVSDMSASAEKVGQWLGISLDGARVEANRSAVQSHITSADVGASIGRWRQDLSPEDASYIEERLRSYMQDFGYL